MGMLRGPSLISRALGIVTGALFLATSSNWTLAQHRHSAEFMPVTGAPAAAGAAHNAWARNAQGRMGFVPLHERIEARRGRGTSQLAGVRQAAYEDFGKGAEQAAMSQTVVDGEIVEGSWNPETEAVSMIGPTDPALGWDPAVGPGIGTPVGCGDPSCGECAVACSPAACRWWFRGQYLLWWTTGADAPPLLTTSPSNTPRESAGELGQANTRVLFGGSELHDDNQSGYELVLGLTLNPWTGHALHARYLQVGPEDADLALSSDQVAVLARPYLDIDAGEQAALLIGYPDFVDGRVRIGARTQLHLVDAATDWPAVLPSCSPLRWQLGYRYTRLTDDLFVEHDAITRDEDTGLDPGTIISMRDEFRTENDFHGVMFGFEGQRQGGCWGLEWHGRLALGSTRGRAHIVGQTTTTLPGGTPTTSSGGLLALGTNDGVFEDSRFAVIPEVGAQLFYDAGCNLRLSIGYNFIYWSQVMRAAEQIDTDVNPTQFPPGQLTGAPRPEFPVKFSDYWAQGLILGGELRF